MILISIFIMIFLTSLTGTLLLAFWKLISVKLEQFGEIRLIYRLLQVVLGSYLIPVVFVCMLCVRGPFDEGEAGGLLTATPFLIKLAKLLSVLWLVGFLMEVMKYLAQKKVREAQRNIGIPKGGYFREVSDKVRERLHVKRDIYIYELKGCKSPFIEGFFRCRIFIPENIRDKKELEMILEHELFHYTQKDLYMKRFCAWIVRVQWFNPLAHELVHLVDIWGDSHCDLHMCYDSSGNWSMKDYFNVIIKYSEKKEKKNIPDGMYMGKCRQEIGRRMERMKKLRTQKRMKRISAAFLTMCFAMASAVTSLAAGVGVEGLYKQAYDLSIERDFEGRSAEPEMEEFTRERDENMEIVESDDEVNLDARDVNSYTWDLKAGVIYETGLFWASKGDEIVVSITPSPTKAETGLGLDQPNGVLRGVSGRGAYSHTFTVNQNGLHRVYAENLESTSIKVVVAVSRD